MEGLPFCRSVDHDDARVDLHVPAQDGASPRDLLARMFSPPSFPIEPEGLLGTWRFLPDPASPSSIEEFEVTAAVTTGGRTLGYRVATDTGSFVYLPDHAPSEGIAPVWNLIEGVDVLLHDAQFTEAERPLSDLYGHATVEDGRHRRQGGRWPAGALPPLPRRSDDQLDRILDLVEPPLLPTVVAREGIRSARRLSRARSSSRA